MRDCEYRPSSRAFSVQNCSARRLAALLLSALALLALVLLPVFSGAEEEPETEIRGYIKGKGWQRLWLGEYPYDAEGTVQPVMWRVLTVEDGKAFLLTEYVIDTSQVIFESDPDVIKKHAYRRISSFEESDLYPLLNTEYYSRLFSNEPLADAIVDDPGHGKLFIADSAVLLNTSYGFSASRYVDDKKGQVLPSHQAEGTEYALKVRGLSKKKGMSCYWLSSLKDGANHYMMQLVGFDGHLSWGAYSRPDVGLRLSVHLDLSKVCIAGGSGTVKDPFVLALSGSDPEPETSPVPETPESEPSPVPEASPDPEPETEPGPEETSEPEETSIPEETAAPEASPEPEKTAVPAPSDREGTALISLVGDCSIGDSIGSYKKLNSYHSVLQDKGYAWPFSEVYHYLAEDDLTVANLEVVLTERKKHRDKRYPLRGKPEFSAVLREGSIEVVNTANNHCWDFYHDGYADTLSALDQEGIARFGSVNYTRQDGFDDLLVRDVNGIRFGFVGFTYPQSSEMKAIQSRIRQLKEEDHCDVVVVSLHWGRETYMTPEAGQIKMATALVESGADVIYGHHPHVLQPVMFCQGKPILFSTGNFTFGTMSKVDPHTGIFRLTYRKTEDGAVLSRLEVIPCQTSGAGDYRPVELTEEKDRKDTFRILTAKKADRNCENPPDYFLETGVILFDENGSILPEMEGASDENNP